MSRGKKKKEQKITVPGFTLRRKECLWCGEKYLTMTLESLVCNDCREKGILKEFGAELKEIADEQKAKEKEARRQKRLDNLVEERRKANERYHKKVYKEKGDLICVDCGIILKDVSRKTKRCWRCYRRNATQAVRDSLERKRLFMEEVKRRVAATMEKARAKQTESESLDSETLNMED